MITIEQTPTLLNIAVMGEFTLSDFKQFEGDALYKLKSPGAVNLLFDLRDMVSYTVDVAWAEIKFFSVNTSTTLARLRSLPTTSG